MAGAAPDYYKMLGVSKDATADDIKKAFRKLARTHHPDAGGDEAKFKEINEAYEVLSDPEKRKMYDQYGTAGGRIPNPGSGDFDFSGFGGWDEILEALRGGGFGGFDMGGFGGFGGYGQPMPQKGRDVGLTLEVTFEEAFNGVEKHVKARIPGSSEPETLTVKVPAGAVDGGRVRFRGKGEAGANGGPAGDLLITTRIKPHSLYSRDGANVKMDLPITVDEAVLGASIVVPAPDGSRLKVKVPAGTCDGYEMRVPGKGAPNINKPGTGDLHLKVKIQVPKQINEEQRKAMEAFAAASEQEARRW